MTQPRRDIIGKFTENFEYTAYIEWQAGPVYVTSENHICALPELFLDFMYSMMKLAERPIHQFPNNAIKFY